MNKKSELLLSILKILQGKPPVEEPKEAPEELVPEDEEEDKVDRPASVVGGY